MNSLRILITGGTGFIGRNLIRDLSAEYDILAPSRQELDLLDDVAVRGYLRSHSVDIVVHGAVKPGHRNAADPTGLVASNTRMFFNLVRNSEYFQRMIFLGSGAVYDSNHYISKMDEDYFDKYVPVDEHGFSKYMIAKYIEQVENTVELRLFGVFGPYEDYSIRFISNAICKTLFNFPITIRQNRFFDYLYIKDLVPVIKHFIHHKGRKKAYNVTPDDAIDLLILAQMVLEVSGKELPILVGQKGLASEYSGDNTRLKDEMKRVVFTPIKESITELYAWYGEHVHQLDRSLLLSDK